MSHVLLLDAGGTISAVRDTNGALAAGRRLTLAGGLASLPVRQVYRGLSEEMRLEDAAHVVAEAQCAAREPDVSGIVLAHGTDAMEETAFLADLVWDSPRPLVFTGAQRAPEAADFDGFDNLQLAVAVAGDSRAHGKGVFLAFGGRLMPASGAFKRDTSALAGFDHRGGDGGPPEKVLETPRRRPAPLPRLRLDPSVETLALGLGSSPRLIEAAVAAGARGLVLQALGRGNAGPAIVAAAARAVEAGCVVLAASRCPFGAAAPDYAAGRALSDAGVLFGGILGAAQGRILLSALLGLHADGATARAAAAAWLEAARPDQTVGR